MSNWYETISKDNTSVISSRIRLARNIKGIPFPKRMNDSQGEEVLNKIKTILDGVTLKGAGTLKYIDMGSVPEEERFAMVERHIISPAFAKNKRPCGLVINEDETLSIMLLEEDHIRIQVILGGLELEKAYEIALSAEKILSGGLDIAFDNELGYLTECPTNLGTGLRASVMLHLPLLENTGSINSLADSVSKIGFTVRGMYGEGSRSSAGLYQLSNQVTLGISENVAIENLKAITNQIVQKETIAREEIEKTSLEDNVFRAVGTLKYARKLTSEEAANLISRVKLGCSMGMIKDISEEKLISLLVNTKPFSLQKAFGRMTSADRDICRAKFIRENL